MFYIKKIWEKEFRVLKPYHTDYWWEFKNHLKYTWYLIKFTVIAFFLLYFLMITWFYIYTKFHEEYSCQIQYLNNDLLWKENWLITDIDYWFAQKHTLWWWRFTTHVSFVSEIYRINNYEEYFRIKWITDITNKHPFNFCVFYDYDELQKWKHKILFTSTFQCIVESIYELKF